jgi:hypothetical protein
VAHKLEYLLDFCNTDRQRRVVELLIGGHTGPEIAVIMEMGHRSGPDTLLRKIKKRAALAGAAPGHFEHGVAEGYRMGKVTVQRAADGTVERTWERQHPGGELALDIIEAAIERLPALTLSPVRHDHTADDDLLTIIPLGDPHFGMLTWEKETGANFNLDIAEEITFAAVDRLVAMSPPSGTAILLNLGDFFHADNASNRTPTGGNQLDVDGRFEKIATTGILAMVRCVQRMLERHAKVIVRCNRGNHDPHQSAMLALALQAWFRNEPRVQIDTSPTAFWYFRFGSVLIGTCHGDGPKMTDLPLIMATDKPEDWGACPFRVWHTGHVHHDSVKDYPGCSVETHRTLAPNDAWHKWKGFRSVRELKAINYHRERGEESRVRCGVQMLEALAA